MTSKPAYLVGVKGILAASYCVVAMLLSGCDDDKPSAETPAAASATAPTTSTSTSPSASPGLTSQTPSTTTSTQNMAPAISGKPSSEVTVGASFSFTPTSTDKDSDKLTFQIANKPDWAAFNTLTGKLTGTPKVDDVGTYEDISIGVSDGQATTLLPTFDITVAQISTGSVTLSWTPPTANTDGSTLSNLAGYKIVYGTDADSLTETITVASAGLSTYVVDNLSPATWYFTIKAYTTAGIESDFSAVVSKEI